MTRVIYVKTTNLDAYYVRIHMREQQEHLDHHPHICSGPLYIRPRQSDMLQGIVDTLREVLVERIRYEKLYGTLPYEVQNIYNTMYMVENSLYQIDGIVRELRGKGL